jgi:hypothetical protein
LQSIILPQIFISGCLISFYTNCDVIGGMKSRWDDY